MIHLIGSKKTINILCVIAVILVIVVGILYVVGILSSVSSKLKDFSIDKLSTEDIIHKEISTVVGSSINYESDTRTGFDGASKYEDSDRVEFKCDKITGIKRISATKVSDCTLTISISSKLSSGKAKIVVICDNEILEYVDVGQDLSFTYKITGEHFYSVKVLCEDAALEIAVNRVVS